MPVIEELLDLILVALKNESDAKPDLFDNYPVDPKRHIVVGQLPLRLRHFRNLLNRISDSLSDMDVDTSEYNILATAYKGMTALFNSALLESVPEEMHSQQFLIRRDWNIVVRRQNIALNNEEIETMKAVESAIADNLSCLIENVALLQVLSTKRPKGTVVNLVNK